MSLFEKRNGKYVCVRDMSASDIVSLSIKDIEYYSYNGWVKKFFAQPLLFVDILKKFQSIIFFCLRLRLLSPTSATTSTAAITATATPGTTT